MAWAAELKLLPTVLSPHDYVCLGWGPSEVTPDWPGCGLGLNGPWPPEYPSGTAARAPDPLTRGLPTQSLGLACGLCNQRTPPGDRGA